MSKAEELSRQYVLPFLDKVYEKYGEHKQMELSKFDGYDMMSSYEEGYHQAEKDLELSWEDMMAIDDLLDELLPPRRDSNELVLKGYYEEVLKRFKDYKERKEK